MAKLDPDFALRFLKWRQQKREGTARMRGAAGKAKSWQRPRSLDEMRESILKKLAAIEAHHIPKQLAEGWTRAEDGTMIPPGWVRAAPPPDS